MVLKHLRRDANWRASIDSLASSVVLDYCVYGVFKSLAHDQVENCAIVCLPSCTVAVGADLSHIVIWCVHVEADLHHFFEARVPDLVDQCVCQAHLLIEHCLVEEHDKDLVEGSRLELFRDGVCKLWKICQQQFLNGALRVP